MDSSITDINIGSATPDYTTYNHSTYSTTGGTDSVYKTVADINAFVAIQPGDLVLFRKGQTWREQLTVPTSGTGGNAITYGAYGSGNNPLITGGDENIGVAGDWTDLGGNIWQKNIGSTTPQVVKFNGTVKGTSNASPSANYEYTYANPNLSVYSVGNPSSYYTSIETSKRSYGIYINGKDYITMDGIDTGLANYYGLQTMYPSTGVTILNVNVDWSGNSSISVYGNTKNDSQTTGVTVQNCTAKSRIAAYYVSDIIIDGCTIPSTDNDVKIVAYHGGTVTIRNSTAPGTSTQGMDVINILNNTLTGSNTGGAINVENGGDGVSQTLNISGNTISNDLYAGVWVSLATAGTYATGVISNNYIKDCGKVGYGNNTGGILIWNGVQNLIVANNMIINTGEPASNRGGIGVRTITGSPANDGTTIINNTIVGHTYSGIKLEDTLALSNLKVKNNITYQTNHYALYVTPSTAGEATNVLNYNNYYRADGGSLIRWNSIDYTGSQLSSYQVTSGKDASSSIANPSFVDISADDYGLTPSSPAIDAGTDVGLTTDFLGNHIYGTPDIGAYEYQPPYTMASDRVDVGAGARVYSDGKFRNKSTTTGITADLSVTPTGGFGTGDYAQWMDITGITWSNSGTHHKVWTESSSVSGLTNTAHIIGDLEANKYYNVKVDNVLGTNITGTDCTSGNCKANPQGEIAFTYTSTYSDHTFDVDEGDNNAPTISSVSSSPSGTDAVITWTTNEAASSKVDYGTSSSYGSSTDESDTSTRVTSHSVTLASLLSCTQYHYRVRSIDATGNETIGGDNTLITTGCSVAILSSSSSSSPQTSIRHYLPSVSDSTDTTTVFPSGIAGASMIFDASGLFPSNTVRFVWDFGDSSTTEGKTVEHSYLNPGRYTITITGYDAKGNQSIVSKTVDVYPTPPTVDNITSDTMDLLIEGTGYQNDIIYLTIHSDPLSVQTQADKDGKWTYRLTSASEAIGEGDHSVSAIDSYRLADNTELKSVATKDIGFKVSIEDGKLKVEMKKASRWRTTALVLGTLVLVLMGAVYVMRRRATS